MFNKHILTAVLTTTAIGIASPVLAQQPNTAANADVTTSTDVNAAMQGQVATLQGQEDGSLVKITGNVGEIRSNEFDLQYNGNKVTVELDRFTWQGNETNYLIPGEEVTVTGYVDDDLFEGREIEAYSVQLNTSDVFYYTNDGDMVYPDYGMEDDTFLTMSGTVSKVEDDSFLLTNQRGAMTVDTSELGYNPFDGEGLQQINNGDRVYVYGTLDKDLFSKDEIVASGMVEMVAGNSQPQPQQAQ